MGSIFKPSSTVVQAPSQSTTTYDIPAYFKEIQERTLRRAEDASKQPFQTFQGQRVAPLSTGEMQAANVVSQQILPQSGQLGAIGAQTFDAATAQQYMNPYENQVIQSALADVQRGYQGQQRNLATSAIGSGAFGGGREGVERAILGSEFQKNIGDVSGRLRQAGFESGAARFAQDRASQLGAAQAQIGALGGAATGLAQMGATGRGIDQANLVEAYRDFVEGQGYEMGQVQQVIGALSGAPIRTYGEERSGYTGQVIGGPSIGGQILGAGVSYFSDIRLKDNIQRIGTSPSGIHIYSFKYKGDNKTYQGVMAHQVPYASYVADNDYLVVDYSQLDVEFKEIH
jgi:hypothetical protein